MTIAVTWPDSGETRMSTEKRRIGLRLGHRCCFSGVSSGADTEPRSCSLTIRWVAQPTVPLGRPSDLLGRTVPVKTSDLRAQFLRIKPTSWPHKTDR